MLLIKNLNTKQIDENEIIFQKSNMIWTNSFKFNGFNFLLGVSGVEEPRSLEKLFIITEPITEENS